MYKNYNGVSVINATPHILNLSLIAGDDTVTEIPTSGYEIRSEETCSNKGTFEGMRLIQKQFANAYCYDKSQNVKLGLMDFVSMCQRFRFGNDPTVLDKPVLCIVSLLALQAIQRDNNGKTFLHGIQFAAVGNVVKGNDGKPAYADALTVL